jgi:hypothetical protein
MSVILITATHDENIRTGAESAGTRRNRLLPIENLDRGEAVLITGNGQ